MTAEKRTFERGKTHEMVVLPTTKVQDTDSNYAKLKTIRSSPVNNYEQVLPHEQADSLKSQPAQDQGYAAPQTEPQDSFVLCETKSDTLEQRKKSHLPWKKMIIDPLVIALITVLIVIALVVAAVGLAQANSTASEGQSLVETVQQMAQQITTLQAELNSSMERLQTSVNQHAQDLANSTTRLETAVKQQAEDLQRHITDSENMLLLIVADNEEKIDGVERVLSDQIRNLDQTKATASDLGEAINALNGHIQEFQEATELLRLSDNMLQEHINTDLHTLDTDHTSRLDELRDDVNGLFTNVSSLQNYVTHLAPNCFYC